MISPRTMSTWILPFDGTSREKVASMRPLIPLLAALLLRFTVAPAQSPHDTIPDDAWLEIHMVDVGQGDGIWIHTFDDGIAGNHRFDGRNIIIDGGPVGSDAKNPFLAYLQEHLAASMMMF